MAAKTDFTSDEWKLLLQSPLLAGIAVSASDPSGLIGMVKESMASARALLSAASDPNADALVKAVAGDFETPEGRGHAEDGVKAAISGAAKPADIVAKALELAEKRLGAARRQGRRRRRPVQDLAGPYRQVRLRSRARGRFSRVRRHAGERGRKGDGRRDRRHAWGPRAGGIRTIAREGASFCAFSPGRPAIRLAEGGGATDRTGTNGAGQDERFGIGRRVSRVFAPKRASQ